MAHKKFLALVLTVCLLLSVLSPAASAVSESIASAVQSGSGTSDTSGKKDDNLLDKIAKKLGLVHSDDEEKLSYSDGQWLVTRSDGTVSVATYAQLPECVQELRNLAGSYKKTDVVSAFVVLEGAPTSESYGTANDVPKSVSDALVAKQDQLIATIEDKVLGGTADIVSRFTFLTNSVVISTEFANLEAIAALDGVKSVFVSPTYNAAAVDGSVSTYTVAAGTMTGISQTWEELGYTGKGITIAVLDTGLDTDHPSFAAAPEGAAWDKDYVQSLLDKYDLNAEERYTRGVLSADDVYYSGKIPFIFNYANGTTNVLHGDGLGDHGTHVAGITAANEVEGSGVKGMAPDAQIIGMKVFNSQTGGADMHTLVAALEDCITIGVDVVNLSLGTAAGFASANDEEIDKIFARISETDMIVDIAVGNDGHSMYGSMYGNYKFLTKYIDTATIASPSTYLNSTAIASAGNSIVYSEYFTLADGTAINYMTPIEYQYGYVDWSLEILADQELEYVIVPNLGNEEDFYDYRGLSIVEGKIAVIRRGTIEFGRKAHNAEKAGAAGVLIWDNDNADIFTFGMTLTYTPDDSDEEYYPNIPTVLISTKDGQTMANAAVKTMTPKSDLYPRVDSNGGQMSSFSSWGCAPELRLLPELTGIGGNVYSCYDGGEYGLMSGTSMATPQVAGSTAVLLQYIREKYPNATESEVRDLVYGLQMSTAVPIIDADTGYEASPRQQGAGLVNTYNAITAKAYLSVAGCDRPKAELGDSKEGKYEFTFTVHNDSDKEKVYNVSAVLLCEDYTTDASFPGEYFIATQEHRLAGKSLSFSDKTVTVPAGGTADVTVSIDLTENDRNWIDTYFPNGNYVEGYVYLKGEGEVTLSLPFMGFYGEWNAVDAFDTGYWYSENFWQLDEDANYPVDAQQYYHALWTSLGSSDNDYLLGFNPYGYTDQDGNLYYDPSNNVVSPNGDGLVDNITDIYLSLMRNAKWMKLTYTDEEGNILHEEVLEYLSKTMYNSSYGATLPFVYSWEPNIDPYDFTDEDGNVLPDGTVVYLNISVIMAYGDDSDGYTNADGTPAEYDQSLPPIAMTIDTTAPELIGVEESVTRDGNFMTLTLKDEHPACVALVNRSGSYVYAQYNDCDLTKNEDGTYSITVDVTGLGDSFAVTLGDYGCNEQTYDLTWSAKGTNNPEVDEDTLFAYRIYDLYIAYYSGYDYMYGWGVIDKETGEYTEQRSDAYEYYAINAAEYAGGYVFAIDTGYNLVRMQPGLWNREWICNTGLNALDMAFDETTGTMYVTAKREIGSNTVYGLYTLDLLTGNIKLICDYDSDYYMPWSMTFVDGKLYAIRKYSAGIYAVDTKAGTMTAIRDEDGKMLLLEDNLGKMSAGYVQSMTYSKADGKIYWAYYPINTSAYGTFVIDPSTWEYEFIPYKYAQEYVGLLTVEPSDYKLPESTEITKVALDATSAYLLPGDTKTLTASALPWNAPMDGLITWESSDPSVATVENSVITAVAPGEATVTASYGSASATCKVCVVSVQGTLHAYNSYSGDGSYMNWVDVDLASGIATDMGECPIDFLAGDYNGHDGYFYGFDMVGQCYRYDPITGETLALGRPCNKQVADMAYDYSSGRMYVSIYNSGSWSTTLYLLDMNTGTLIEFATGEYVIYVTLACDMEGNLYGINTEGKLCMFEFYEGEAGGGEGGIMPLSIYADGSADTYFFEGVEILSTGYELNYAQSMCYDANNDVIIWACADYGTIYWIDLNRYEKPVIMPLDAPVGITSMSYFGMHVIPDAIPELSLIPVESITADDQNMLVGATLIPPVMVEPINATNRTVVYTSADPSVVEVKDGALVALKAGETTVTATVTDGENVFKTEFTVRVKNYTSNLYAFQLYDLYTGDSDYFMYIDPKNPANYEYESYVGDENGTIFLLYSAEYVPAENVIYSYGYIAGDTGADWYFLTIDPATWQITESINLGMNFSTFVYDMAYDFTTGTMYAVAQPSNGMSNLYYVDVHTGTLTLAAESGFEELFGIAIDAEGTIYISVSGDDTETGTAWMYTVDPDGTFVPLLDTGIKSNAIAPMCYDFDTGYVYWNAFYILDYFSPMESCLYLFDTNDGTFTELGMLGTSGSQITSMISFAKEYPEVPSELVGVTMLEDLIQLNVGETHDVSLMLRPYFIDSSMAQFTWTSSDSEVARVDENGRITALSAGETTVTVTVTSGEKSFTLSARVLVYGESEYMIAYNTTKKGFAAVSRTDSSDYRMLTINEPVGVASMVIVNGIIYGYDDNGYLFLTSEQDNFRRTIIGKNGVELPADYDEESNGNIYRYSHYLDIRDMAWDSANNRMLALATIMGVCNYTFAGEEYTAEYVYAKTITPNSAEYTKNSGCLIYEVDMETGKMTPLTQLFYEQLVYEDDSDDPWGDIDSGGMVSVAGYWASYWMLDGYVVSMTVDSEGTVYVLSGEGSTIRTVDLDDGHGYDLYAFKKVGAEVSGAGNVMSMTYDATFNALYVTIAESTTCYEMYRLDLETGVATYLGFLGDVDPGVYYNTTDVFRGLALNEGHVCSDKVQHLFRQKDATCDYGYTGDWCCACGQTVYEYGTVLAPIEDHNYTESGRIEPTCTTDGSVYLTCDGCGDVIVQVLNAYGHTMEDVEGKDATCAEDGYTEHKRCAVCGYTEEKYVLKATGKHDYQETMRVEASCASNGFVTKTCAVCGDTVTEVIDSLSAGHTWDDGRITIAAGCATTGEKVYYCTVCGKAKTETIKATGDHTWSTEYEIAKEATCSTRGIIRYYCTECGDAFFEDAYYGEHNWQLTETVTAPTCATNGTGNYECSVCHETKSDEIVADPEAHNFVQIAGTGSSVVRVCSDCGYTVIGTVSDCEHDYKEIVRIEATCEAEGSVIKSCSICGDTVTETLPACEHDYKEIVRIEATCEAAGSVIKSCGICGGTVTETVPATGHSLVDVSGTAATCTEEGCTDFKRCSACGYEEGKQAVAATGAHSYELIGHVDATTSANGMDVKKCSVCGDVVTESIAQLSGSDTGTVILIVVIAAVVAVACAAGYALILRKKKD